MPIVFEEGSQCIFCKRPIHDANPEPEHIMLAGWGGRLRAIRLLCNEHNHSLGSTIDNDLLESFDFIRNDLQVRSDNRGRPPQVRSSDRNAPYYIQHDRRPHLRAHRELHELEDGSFNIENTTDLSEPHTSLTMLINELRGRNIITQDKYNEYASMFNDLGGDVGALEEVITVIINENERVKLPNFISGDAGYPDPIKKNLSFNNPNMKRAIAKIAFEYFAIKAGKDIVLHGNFDDMREYILNSIKRDIDMVVFENMPHKPFVKTSWPFPISVWVFCDPENNNVVGVFRLLGVFEFIILIATQWTGDKICYYWATNPQGADFVEETYNDFTGIPTTFFVSYMDNFDPTTFKNSFIGAFSDMSRKIALLNLSEKMNEAAEEIRASLTEFNDREMSEEDQAHIIQSVFGKLQTYIQSRSTQQ